MVKKSASRAGTGKSVNRKAGASKAERERGAPPANRDVCAKCGQVHPGCHGHTKHGPNAGKPCGAQVRKGQVQCPKHGGNHPGQRKAGRERLLELVEPALVELTRIIAKKNTTDADKLRAIQMVLDRTGYGPRSTLAVDTSKFDAFMDAAQGVPQLNRSGVGMGADALPGGGGGDRLGWEDVAQHQTDARRDNWRDLDAEDAPRRIYPDSTTVVGEVVPDADA